MKAGDLVKWYKEEVSVEGGEAYYYHKSYPAIVLKDYDDQMNIIKLFVNGETLYVHSSECTLIEKGYKWKDTKKL
tara:strand:+ start:75 stop:299 length:225 start_codon:yes stop_codon:yes gene_type:complete